MVKNLPVNAGDARDLGSIHRKIPWRMKWQPTPVLFSGECHGQRSLADKGSGDKGLKSQTWLSTHIHIELRKPEQIA